jgi:hypothetical protein
MRRISLALFALSLFAIASPFDTAQAQATRTWVSGVGDDANPCSRTAPCKTFAGAISKTAASGEIDALDPGGFGAVTITKSITIDGGGGQGGQAGGILSSLTNGVIINAGANDRIVLRNFTINGAGTGINGVNFLAGNALEVENLKITGVTNNCINFQPSVRANLLVTNSSFTNCAAGGVVSSATSGGSNLVTINRSTVYKSAVGVTSGQNSTVEIWNSVLSNNGGGGAQATTATSQLNVDSSAIVNNGSFGVQASNSGIVRLSNTSITGNATTGLLSSAGGQILTWQNNWVAGNNPDGSRTGTVVPQ